MYNKKLFTISILVYFFSVDYMNTSCAVEDKTDANPTSGIVLHPSCQSVVPTENRKAPQDDVSCLWLVYLSCVDQLDEPTNQPCSNGLGCAQRTAQDTSILAALLGLLGCFL